MPETAEKQDKKDSLLDPVALSYFMGEPEPDLENIPTEDDLAKKRVVDEHAQAKRDQLKTKSFGSLGSVDFDELGDEDKGGEPEKNADDGEAGDGEAGKEPTPEGKKKKKVTFRKPPEETEPEEYQPPEDQYTAPQEETEVSFAEAISDDDKDFLKSQPEEAVDSVAFYMDAEWVDPAYKGAASRQLEYLKKHAEKIRELEEEDPEVDLTESSKYISWVKNNKPQISNRERRRLEQEIITKEAEIRVEQRLESKYRAEIDESRNWRERQEKLPKVQQQSQGFAKTMLSTLGAVPEATESMGVFNKVFKETGDVNKAAEAMKTQYPEETEILGTTNRVALALGSELISLKSGVRQLDLQGNRLHQELVNRINAREKAMVDPKMKDKRVRGGKSFVRAYDYQRMAPDQRQKHWTFSTEDMLGFIREEATQQVRKRLKAHKDHIASVLQKYGKNPPASKIPTNKPPVKKAEDQPRHQGTDSPASAPRQASGTGDSNASRLVDWDD